MLGPQPYLRIRLLGRSWSKCDWGLAAVAAAIALAWLLAASRWIVTDTVVPWDAKNQFYVFFRFLASSFSAGHTPFWNPFHYGGHPSVADPQSLVFAPAFLAWAFFDSAPTIRAFDLIVYAHLLAGGLAVGVLGWRAGWPFAATLLAAVVFMFGGPASGRLQHTGIIVTYGLFPVALLLLRVALERVSVPFAAAFALVASALALGRNQEALLLCVVLAGVLVAEIASAPDWRCYLRERRWTIAAIGIVGAAVMIVPLLLTVQFAALSNRPHVVLEKALEASLYPANLATMAVANVMGSLESTQTYWGPNYDTLPAVGSTDRSFNYLFVGASTTVVILWFGIAAGWAFRLGRRFLTGVLIVALLFMIGRYSPVYTLAFEFVPGINLFRRPIDGAFVFVAALALLAGQLLADYVYEGVPRISRGRAFAVIAAALGIVAWAVAFSEKTHHGWQALQEVAKALPIAVIVIATLLAARSDRARPWAAAMVALIATGELIWWNAASSLNAEAPAYYSVLQRPAGEDARALAVLEEEIAARHAQGERPRVEIVGVSGPWQNLAIARGLEATNGYNPLRIGTYDRLVSPGETTHIVDQRLFPASFNSYDCALARELGLEYLVLGRPIEEVPHLARRPVADVLLAGPKAWIYRLKGAEPRVKFMTRVVIADADAQVRAGLFSVNPGGDPATVDDDTVPKRTHWPMTVRSGASRAHIVSWRPDKIEIEVDSPQPGILVVHEIYYPGWFAEVDGQPTSILRTNVLFRGVEVSEGRHRIVFRFLPFSLANLREAASSALKGRKPPAR